MQVGQKREVLLNSDSCSGNVWQLAEELPADSPVAVSLSGAEPDETNCCGFPVPVTLTISALKPGSAVLRLVYANPKEKAPARQEEFKVTVSAADAVE